MQENLSKFYQSVKKLFSYSYFEGFYNLKFGFAKAKQSFSKAFLQFLSTISNQKAMPRGGGAPSRQGRAAKLYTLGVKL